jgi:chemotaxis protein methyltransferase CheR
MIAALTTNVTRFFREPHHFEHFREKVAPRLIDKAKRGERVRLWSAACSSGEEPYSLAMTLHAVFPNANDFDVRILATDIDSYMIQRGKAAEYADRDVETIPEDLRRRFITRSGNPVAPWRVDEKVCATISFKQLNLIGDWPFKGKFDAIFCRNVAIYFDDETQKQLWTKFNSRLVAEGRLYIGHSERVEMPTLTSDGLTVYRLVDARST